MYDCLACISIPATTYGRCSSSACDGNYTSVNCDFPTCFGTVSTYTRYINSTLCGYEASCATTLCIDIQVCTAFHMHTSIGLKGRAVAQNQIDGTSTFNTVGDGDVVVDDIP